MGYIEQIFYYWMENSKKSTEEVQEIVGLCLEEKRNTITSLNKTAP